MIQDTFTSQLVAELLDWRVLFGVLALYHWVLRTVLMLYISVYIYISLSLSLYIYIILIPLLVSARRRVMDGVETTDELLLSAESLFQVRRVYHTAIFKYSSLYSRMTS